MIQYKTFDFKDEEEINKFFKENSEGISRDGLIFKDDKVCILYLNEPKETAKEADKQATVAAVKAWVNQYRANLINSDHQHRYWLGECLKGVEGAEKNARNANEDMQIKQTELKYAEQILEEVEKGEWMKK